MFGVKTSYMFLVIFPLYFDRVLHSELERTGTVTCRKLDDVEPPEKCI